MDETDQKLKLGHHPLFIPNIPFFSPSRRLYEPEANIPLFHWLSNGKHYPYGVKAMSGPLGQDSLLLLYRSETVRRRTGCGVVIDRFDSPVVFQPEQKKGPTAISTTTDVAIFLHGRQRRPPPHVAFGASGGCR